MKAQENRRMNRAAMFMAALLLCAASAPAADDSAGPGVSSSGQATLKKRPEILRVKLMLTADGKDVRTALAALNQKRDAAKKSLMDLGAAADAFDPGEPVVGAGNLSPQQRQIQLVMNARNRRPTTQPQGVTVSCAISAEWPLGGDAGDAVATADDLETKIKSALPKAGGEKKPQTPEEQELAEEMAAASNGDNSDPTAAKPDEPNFLFVHKVSEEERSKLTSDALADATADAKRLATAAGKTLGAIREISSNPASSGEDENPYTAYVRAMSGQGTDAATPTEAVGSQAGAVTYSVHVNAVFELK